MGNSNRALVEPKIASLRLRYIRGLLCQAVEVCSEAPGGMPLLAPQVDHAVSAFLDDIKLADSANLTAWVNLMGAAKPHGS